jgi:hypothetical protein
MSVHTVYFKGGEKTKYLRPVLTREEYLRLRNGGEQQSILKAVRSGDESRKSRLVQMNYSCLPNDDGSLKGSTRMSTTVGMDIDHIADEQMLPIRERILAKKDELGLLMLEVSARQKGYHLVFRRRPELSQEENLRWASGLLDVKFDEGAKDITRVFFTTTEQDLIYLDDVIFDTLESGHFVTSEMSAKNVQTPSVAEAPKELKFPREFKGIPYTSIIAEWWRRNGGEPAEGERNDKLHQLAANLRAICDNSEDWLLEVMPRYGLGEQEMRSIVHSACKEPTKGSRLIRKIIDALASPDPSQGGEVEDEQEFQHPLLGRGLGRLLPIGLRESLVGVPASMYMPVLCGVLPIAAAYADQVQVLYCDGNLQHLGLMSIIRGEQASNKSVVKNAVDVWKRQFDEEDALARKREEEWKERKKSRKANEKAPEDPKVLIRMVPVTVSCSTLLKRFKNSGGHTLYSFGEELDTLRKTNGAGSWSSKYDIYRLSFDKGEWGQDYNSDQAESGVVKVAYNWTMLGTDGAMRKCFKSDNIENGLSSRVLVAEMPDSSFSKMPKFGRRSAEDEAKIQEAVTRLRSYSGLIDTPRLRKAIEEWVEEKRVEAAKDIDHVKDTYRKRAAVIGFRCGVIHHLLTMGGKKSDISLTSHPSPLTTKEAKASIDFAVMMAEYCLVQQIKAFGEVLQSQYVDASDECQRYGSNHSVFDQLAPSFTMDDRRALKRGFCGEAALRKIISKWYHDKWIEKTDRNHWRKLSNDN